MLVGGKVVLGTALARLGVQTTWMGPAPDPGMMGTEARFSDDQRRRFRASLRRVYSRFLRVVSQGRDLPESSVESVAQGRVWTGAQAAKNGLVDTLGTPHEAVDRVAVLAGLQPQRCRSVAVRFKPPKFGAISQLIGGQSTGILRSALGGEDLLLRVLYSSPGEPLALVPIELDPGAWSGWSP